MLRSMWCLVVVILVTDIIVFEIEEASCRALFLLFVEFPMITRCNLFAVSNIVSFLFYYVEKI